MILTDFIVKGRHHIMGFLFIAQDRVEGFGGASLSPVCDSEGQPTYRMVNNS